MAVQDWSRAPADAQFYSCTAFRKHEDGREYKWRGEAWIQVPLDDLEWHRSELDDFEMRPAVSERSHPAAACQYVQWPESDDRIDAIGQNGGDWGYYVNDPATAWTPIRKQQDVSATLSEREQTYGDFATLAAVVEGVQEIYSSLPGWDKASPAHREAAHMIIQKLARAFNGNPHYSDSWHDISGYSQLAEKECIK